MQFKGVRAGVTAGLPTPSVGFVAGLPGPPEDRMETGRWKLESMFWLVCLLYPVILQWARWDVVARIATFPVIELGDLFKAGGLTKYRS